MERRSGRQRKAVDYKQIVDGDPGDSDDDFVGPPPPKRPKESPAGKLLRDRPPEHRADLPRTKRLSREEKMNNRALEQALQASQTSMSDPINPIHPKSGDTSTKDTSTRDRDDEFIPENEEKVLSDEEDVPSEDSGSDFYSTSPIKTEKKHKTNRSAITLKSSSHKNCQKPVQKSSKVLSGGLQTSGSQTTLELDSRATLTSAPRTTQQSAITETMSNVNERVTKNEVVSLSPKSRQPPKASLSHTTPTVGRISPKWTPPSRVGEGHGLTKSPIILNTSNTPVIRVGLSRHARIKPLHSNRT